MALHSLSEFLPCSQNTKKGRAWTRLNSLIADETSSRVTLRLHNNQKAAICLVVTKSAVLRSFDLYDFDKESLSCWCPSEVCERLFSSTDKT